MKYIFQRGNAVTSASADSVLFRFGRSPGRSPGSTFSCLWDEPTAQLTHTHHDLSENIALVPSEKDKGVYSFSHPEFALIHLVKRSWFADPPVFRGERGVMMSVQGWSEGVWCDGIYARWHNARLTDLILPGGPFRVEWGRHTEALLDFEEWSTEQKYFAQKMSLIEAVRSRFGGRLDFETVLDAPQGSYEEVLTLLLLRLAFPKQRFSLLPRNEGQKRLAQNLNITPLRIPLKNASVLAADCDWGSSEAVQQLLAWQLRQSPFIPTKLWNDLKPGF